jgi:hypothetical protein
MDYGHLRWYTVASFSRLLAAHHFALLQVTGEGTVPMPYLRRWLTLHDTWLDRWGATTFPGLFGYQLLFVAEKPADAPAPALSPPKRAE